MQLSSNWELYPRILFKHNNRYEKYISKINETIDYVRTIHITRFLYFIPVVNLILEKFDFHEKK